MALNVPIAINVAIEASEDGRYTALLFKTRSTGPIAVALENPHISKLVARLINQATKVAAQRTPEKPPDQMSAVPILASHMGLAKGRSDSEALLAFRVGNLDLTLAVDVSMLHGLCTRLLSITKKTAPPRRQ